MADNLGDDWWNEDPVTGDDGEEQSGPDDEVKEQALSQTAKDTPSQKRSHQEADKETKGSESGNAAHKRPAQGLQDEGEPKKKKKRRKKKKLSEHIAETQKPGTPTDLRESLHHHYQGKLSAIEMQDLQLTDKCFLSCNTQSESLSNYLKSCIPKWNNLIKKHKPVKPQTCLLLMVTASARRAVELNRQAAEFKGQCVSAKLFAKHLKITDQVKMLNKAGAHFAVGTPNRISSLIQSDAINQEESYYLVIDWNWRDVKQRRIVDVPEVRQDLFELLKKYVIPTTRTGERLRIGLF